MPAGRGLHLQLHLVCGAAPEDAERTVEGHEHQVVVVETEGAALRLHDPDDGERCVADVDLGADGLGDAELLHHRGAYYRHLGAAIEVEA